MKLRYQPGEIHPSTIMIVVMTVLFIGAGSFGIWAFMQYQDKKTDVDGQISSAVADAKNEQAKEDEVKIQAAKEEPFSQFVGPDDYGRVTFDYPRNWSVYEANSVSNGSKNYEAYLNPVYVPPVDDKENRFALRVTISDKQYDEVVADYQKLVEKGELSSKSFSVDSQTGIRLDGTFKDEIRGAAIVLKIRDKTLTIQTDADTFKPYFDEIIKTIEFNK